MGIHIDRKWGEIVLPAGKYSRQRTRMDDAEALEREQEIKELSDSTDFPVEFILAIQELLVGQQDLQVVLSRLLEDDDVYRIAPELTWRDANRVYYRFYPRQ